MIITKYFKCYDKSLHLLRINIGSCFIKYQDGVITYDGPSEAYQLALPYTEIATSFHNLRVKPRRQIIYDIF